MNSNEPNSQIPTGNGTTPAQNQPSPQPSSQPSPPPAAVTVLNGGITEESSRLAEELESTRKALKERELRMMELEDENFRIKQATGAKPAPAAPAPPAKKKGIRWTFFHEEE